MEEMELNSEKYWTEQALYSIEKFLNLTILSNYYTSIWDSCFTNMHYQNYML